MKHSEAISLHQKWLMIKIAAITVQYFPLLMVVLTGMEFKNYVVYAQSGLGVAHWLPKIKYAAFL